MDNNASTKNIRIMPVRYLYLGIIACLTVLNVHVTYYDEMYLDFTYFAKQDSGWLSISSLISMFGYRGGLQYVQIDDISSSIVSIKTGKPQGSILDLSL